MASGGGRARLKAGWVWLARPAVVGVAGPGAVAQESEPFRDTLRQAAKQTGLANSVQGLTGFAALPGVSAANFTVEAEGNNVSDARMSKIVVPLAHEFESARLAGGALRTELTLGYSRPARRSTNSSSARRCRPTWTATCGCSRP